MQLKVYNHDIHNEEEKETTNNIEIENDNENILERIEENDEENEDERNESVLNRDNDKESRLSKSKSNGFTTYNDSELEIEEDSGNDDQYNDPSKKQSEKKFLSSSRKSKVSINQTKKTLASTKRNTSPFFKSKLLDDKLTLTDNKSKNMTQTYEDDVGSKMFEEQIKAESLKDAINKKFFDKLEKLLNFLLKTNLKFENPETSPIILLEKLKKATDMIERNELVFQIETFITNNIKIAPKKEPVPENIGF